MGSKNKSKNKNGLELGELIFWLMVIGAVSYTTKNIIKNSLLESNYKIIDAVIIDSRNPLGNSRIPREFTYSYRFCLGDDCYTNNSLDTGYKIGNRVKVKYYERYPAFNEIYRDKK
ncbi:hypothetical protein GCM10011375_31450 [Hymenobacter qilianensis]|uniref:Uncharacterized protein n=1 Tax=Hymenobacter qilianensis TaxID=1385715 RepID=A0ACB5PUX6_9BACT|nr:hypothetical protein GCM10011375_31450 [Hymenobacter qilianensis]